jgi:hypothetical protein
MKPMTGLTRSIMMTSNLPVPAAVAAADKTPAQMVRVLNDVDLAAVNGGGNVHAACVRAVGRFLTHEMQRY